MRLPKLFTKDEPREETACPRCGTPAPAGAVDCAACGWDMRETYSAAGAQPPGAP